MATGMDTDELVRIVEPTFYQIGYRSQSNVAARVMSTSIKREIGYLKLAPPTMPSGFRRSFPAWSVAAGVRSRTDTRGRSDLEHAFGWPLLAMSVHRMSGQFSGGGGQSAGGGGGRGGGTGQGVAPGGGPTMTLERGIEVPTWLTPWAATGTGSPGSVVGQGPQFAQALPTRILPWGFIANSLLNGVVLFVLVSAVPFWRCRFRRVRGRCLNCGYDLRGGSHEKCPECGTALGSVSK